MLPFKVVSHKKLEAQSESQLAGDMGADKIVQPDNILASSDPEDNTHTDAGKNCLKTPAPPKEIVHNNRRERDGDERHELVCLDGTGENEHEPKEHEPADVDAMNNE
jgi:hypothetical protein